MTMQGCLRWMSALVGVGLLAGCAGLNTLSSDVSTFGEWPAARKPGTYAFERLPSQQARAEAQARLEDAARPALAAAGFQPVAAGAEPDVLVQIGARVTRFEISPWADPLWWRGGFGVWRPAPWGGTRWSLYAHEDLSRVERDVALLLRDRASGKPLYEARASNTSSAGGGTAGLKAMFAAALKDFPAVGLNPRVVVVPLTE